MTTTSLSVLLTCFNRRDETLACLDALAAQTGLDAVVVSIVLVDDGSSDGTAEAVREAYPDVRIETGDGSLFWAGGMRRAMAAARERSPARYLWLNDDTMLYPNAIRLLLDHEAALHAAGHAPVIVAGSTCDPESGATTYGGVLREAGLRRMRFRKIDPGPAVQRCDTINGNCVLIPAEAVARVGLLDDGFRHYLADFDYGLRAAEAGVSTWLVPGYVGTCKASLPNRTARPAESVRTRVGKLDSPKGVAVGGIDLPPFAEWRTFCRRHGGTLWPLFWLLPYRRVLSPFR